MSRKVAALLLVALAACGGNAGYEVLPDRSMAAARGITLPDPVEASPAFLLSFDRAISPAGAEKAAALPGVAVAVPVSLSEQRVEGPGGATRLRVGGVDPLLFRSLAPEPTRSAEFVWSALIAGEAVVTFDAGATLGIEGSGDVAVGGTELRAGAIADNGVPNLADVLVADFAADGAGLPGPRLLAVGVTDPDRATAVG
ncbi:MAG TPA: hypothetical protein VHJ76_07055, partial [Actinomycetota bacterium]|nr:hypothetical protein [Actinomycetota bacterium]